LFFSCKRDAKQTPTVSNIDNALIEKLEAAINYEIKSKNLNAISIALVNQQETVWAKGFGHQDADKKQVATAQTVYRVGSVSKLFTDMAIMQEVEKGKINLDAPIQTYLPDFQPNNPFGKAITLRQLMSHRSGLLREPMLGNYFDNNQVSLQETVESINKSSLIHAPESKTKYSNAGIAVVGYVLEKLYQEPYVDYMQKAILNPIGMESSAFAPTPSIQERLAAATMWSYDGRQFAAPVFELGMAPAGSLYASVEDLGLFLKMLFAGGKGKNGTVISTTTLAEMWSPQFGGTKTSGYGVGFRLSDFKGHQKVGHGGAIYGFSTQLSALPELGLGVACASSVDITNTITRRLSNYALELLYAHKKGEQLPDYQRTTAIDPATKASLVGTYQKETRVVQIVNRNGELVLLTDRIETPLRQGKESIISDGRLNFGSFKIEASQKGIILNGKEYVKIDAPKKSNTPADWQGLIGEYGEDHSILYVYEDRGKLWLLIEWMEKDQLEQVAPDVFAFPEKGGMYHGEKVIFTRGENGEATAVAIENGPIFKRRDVGASTNETFRIQPVMTIDKLREIALAANPPQEEGNFTTPDLVDLKTLDNSIRYDIRYATTNNFMSNEFYTLAKAYMQRPAAEAVVRVHQKLQKQGYGLLIHDAYRPWYVTKMFWDATPADKKIFVANPDNGSRHNRGCAVDLTLFDLKTGKVIEMVAGYDEMTDRSFPDYYGGTTEQRWHRSLLREAMEAEGFSIYEYEWWHFDYKDWKQYGLGNSRFEDL
jgi:serine beta-lactamase-like protein LACTB